MHTNVGMRIMSMGLLRKKCLVSLSFLPCFLQISDKLWSQRKHRPLTQTVWPLGAQPRGRGELGGSRELDAYDILENDISLRQPLWLYTQCILVSSQKPKSPTTSRLRLSTDNALRLLSGILVHSSSDRDGCELFSKTQLCNNTLRLSFHFSMTLTQQISTCKGLFWFTLQKGSMSWWGSFVGKSWSCFIHS